MHFPVALLLVAALAEMGYILWRKPFLEHAVSLNLHLSAASAIGAAVLGWALATVTGIEPELRSTLFWHRWLGTSSAVLAVAALALWHYHRAQMTKRRLWTFRGVLFAGAISVSLAGHLGGLLVYGLDFYHFSLK